MFTEMIKCMNILVTAIGSFSADYVVSSLKSMGHRVYACDIYPAEWHAVSKDCEKTYRVSFATQGNQYIRELIEICLNDAINCIIPLTDLEIDILNKYRREFSDINVSLLMQSEQTLSLARNKYFLYQSLEVDGDVFSPKTVLSKDVAEDFRLPAVAKPISGRSSEGLRYVNTLEDLRYVKQLEGYIVQEKIDGFVHTVDYVRNSYDGSFVAIPRIELLRTKNGAGTTVKIVNNSELIQLADKVGKKLNVHGCVNMEFIGCTMNYRLIDVNPRFSAGVAFSGMAGYNMVDAHIRCFLNKAIRSMEKINEMIIAKRYREEILL